MKGVVKKKLSDNEESEYYNESEESHKSEQRDDFIEDNVYRINKTSNIQRKSVDYLMK